MFQTLCAEEVLRGLVIRIVVDSGRVCHAVVQLHRLALVSQSTSRRAMVVLSLMMTLLRIACIHLETCPLLVATDRTRMVRLI